MTRVVFILCLFVSFWSLGQMDSTYVKDTIDLKLETRFETSQEIGLQTDDLSQDLEAKTPVFIKSYGAGNLATITYQGTSASQTALFWNGINLTPLNSGTTDYTLIDSYLFDEFSLGTGQNTRQGSGIGADIILNNSVNTDIKTRISGLVSYGTFNDGKLGFKYKAADSLNVLSVSVLGGKAQNNYSFYHSSNKQFEERVNNHNQFLGGLLSYHRVVKNGYLYLKSWNRVTEREIPAPILVQNQEEMQDDFYSRNVVGLFQALGNGMEWETSLAYLTERYEYNNPTADILGIGEIDRVNANATLEQRLNTKLEYQFTLFGDLQKALISDNRISRNLIGGALKLSYDIKDNWNATGVLRKELYVEENNLPYALDLNTSYKITKNKVYARYYRNARIPTLNDLYWENGGNINLESELAKTFYVGFVRDAKLSSNVEYFTGNIEQMIQWTPNSGNGLWQPENIGFVKRSGVNLELNYKTELANQKVEIGVLYAYIKAKDDDGFQLIYTPVHQYKWWLNFTLPKGFSLSYNGLLADKRFVTRDHSAYLPYFTVSDISISKRFKLSDKLMVNSQIKVDNILDYTYYNIPFRPMPGRYIGFQLTIDYVK